MRQKITQKDLEAVVRRLNLMTNSPLESYTRTKEGKLKANVGNYHLSYAYGGVSLHRMNNEAGGVQDVLSSGHIPKKELYNMMHAYIRGLSTNEGEV